MNATEFVEVLRMQVQEATTQGVVSLLERPPGRQPFAGHVALSEWFNALSDGDKEHVRAVVAMASDQATFGILALLDGVRAIESGPNRGTLELWHVSGAGSVLLNDPSRPLLHDLFRQV